MTDAVDRAPLPPERVLLAEDLALTDHGRAVLEPTTVELRTGRLLLAVGDPGPRHQALALGLAGRLAGHTGRVTLDGVARPTDRHATVALVDLPGVTAPSDDLALRAVVAEELALSGRAPRRGGVGRWLERHRLAAYAGTRWGDLPGPERTSVLCRLAALRPGVDFVVLVLPERHGGPAGGWLPTARELAAADFGVLVTVSLGVAGRLGEDGETRHLPTVIFGNGLGDDPHTAADPDPETPEAQGAVPDLPSRAAEPDDHTLVEEDA